MKYTFQDFQREFPDDGACLAKLMEINYGGTRIICPGCGKEAQFHAMTTRRGYACQLCGHHIYPAANTIFHKSRTKLTQWFFAMYLMTSTRHGVAAKEIERQLGVTYKTAWRMCHELRKLMAAADHDGNGPLSGHIEVDETLIGGRNIGHGHVNFLENKTTVFGMLQRDGRIIAGPVPNRRRKALTPVITKNVERGSIISSDEWKAYHNLGSLGFTHGRVNHSADQWVVGEFHTNSIEGYWSQLKRSITGTHIHVSRKHLWKYVSEFSYRRNMRHSHHTMFHRLVAAFSLPRLVDL